MGSKKTTTTSQESAVTTPNVPGYAQQPIANLFSGVNNYATSNPYDYVTRPTALQNIGFERAQALGADQSLFNAAANAAKGELGQDAQFATAGMGLLGPASQATGQGYSPSILGNANTAKMYNATAATAGDANTYNPTLLGGPAGYNAAQATSQGYNVGSAPTTATASANLSNQIERVQAQSLLDNLSAYQNPATAALVDTTLASFDDNAARARAANQAASARNGAFGGSRLAIQDAQTERDMALARASTEAGLRNTAFNNAINASQYDATNRQNAGLANAAAQNQRTEAVANLGAQTSMFNAGQRNNMSLAAFNAQNEAAQFGANAANQASMFNAGQTNNAGQFNANNANQFALTNAAAQNQAGQFNANAANQFALTNAGFRQDANLQNAQTANALSQFNAGQQNQFALTNAGMQADAAQFGAQAQNTANLANQQANNQFALSNFDAQNAMNQFNANAFNQNQQFNSNQDLQAIGLLGDLANQKTQADIANQQAIMNAGNTQWQLQDQWTQAPLTQLQNTAGLLNPGLISSISGQTINTNGTSTSKQSGGLLNSLLSAGAQLGSAAIMASERRVKRDIELLGREPDGLGVYSFRYIWDDEPQTGVMVDEVEVLRPWALGPVVNGIQTVDYSKLEAA